jgi:hypothetical protein
MPAKQLEHAVVPVLAEYLPTTQEVHDVDALAPATARYLPVTQLAHADDPVVEANLPVAQSEHNVDDVAPYEALYLPTGHDAQLVAFVLDWYWPDVHGVHGDKL